MKHRIDPKVDCVFKALLGSQENSNLLIDFLNSILVVDLDAPITEVTILNPYNEKEFMTDKLSIVDVKASDDKGHLYQVEIQLSHYENLDARMLYNWAVLYSKQLQSGDGYQELKPAFSIWLLNKTLIQDSDYAHEFKMQNDKGCALINHGGIWILELNKFKTDSIVAPKEKWLAFFKEGENLDDNALPDWMQTKEMRQAMNTLKQFSEKERQYHLYQARQDYLREQATIAYERDLAEQKALRFIKERDAALQEKKFAVQEKESALQEKESALQREALAQAEIERLKKLLGNKVD
jgi:predicted transposase/invertase (TIGR01784 family)